MEFATRPETAPRWTGENGRLEVWYATGTTTQGTGWWIHYEGIAPTDGSRPYMHGWTAVFPVDGEPVVERFGPGVGS